MQSVLNKTFYELSDKIGREAVCLSGWYQQQQQWVVTIAAHVSMLMGGGGSELLSCSWGLAQNVIRICVSYGERFKND